MKEKKLVVFNFVQMQKEKLSIISSFRNLPLKSLVLLFRNIGHRLIFYKNLIFPISYTSFMSVPL